MAKKDINKDNKNKNFGKELKSELKKVTWPTPKELVNSTSAVITVILIISVIVFILDVCFENLNKFGVEKLKKLVSSNSENVEEVTGEDLNSISDETESADNDQQDETEIVSEENIDNTSAETSTEETN